MVQGAQRKILQLQYCSCKIFLCAPCNVLGKEEISIRKGGNMSEGRSSHGMGIIDLNNEPTLVAFGGTNGPSYFDSVDIWDDINETWKLSNITMKKERSDFAHSTVPTELLCPEN